MNVRILVANASHVGYAERICELMYISALERGTGIARRSPEYIREKMNSGKAVIALDGKQLVGFSYIETWSHKSFVANSGLIVDHAYRHLGIASRIKKRIFNLSRKMYPQAKIFGITTGAAVMKINSKLGYRPVPFSELTHDEAFWKGCRGCRNNDILMRNDKRMCLCTGMLYDPAEHLKRKTTNSINPKKINKP
ncbi:MAG: GNAT family N-acetyltransferase [Bacteroidales bacterium]|nr:GNAT family N-acetyltransferase [Bacteroidales bacterium]MDD2831075.1 GNAT family N-acetyltransferase [Bacteroidales bacterium]MDD3208117.1 GNAT family N-acetyltransferase [Bacteroidales bacterium]MDD4167142.1 GNAT family N-acetyltransferase [Bacteroidales bacterium]MDD4472690.1 GNAT family N-acetyltransferase [Bacteroidales bacterium]